MDFYYSLFFLTNIELLELINISFLDIDFFKSNLTLLHLVLIYKIYTLL